MLHGGHSGDECDLTSIFIICFELGTGATSESENISSELLMCGGGVRSILLLSLVTRCLETIDVCIWCMFVFMFVVVTVWGSVGNLLCSGRC